MFKSSRDVIILYVYPFICLSLLMSFLMLFSLLVARSPFNGSDHVEKGTYWKICKIVETRPLTSDKIGIRLS